jgi:glyoxylase-like metal-dependent hydrolase (beta-lactamase superfamily II)
MQRQPRADTDGSPDGRLRDTASPSPPTDEIGILKVQGNVYMLVGATGNIAAQVGDDGILVVNTGTEAMAPKLIAALRTLSDKPILWVVNTDADQDHIGGNDALPKSQRPRATAARRAWSRMRMCSTVGPATPKAVPSSRRRCGPTTSTANCKDFSFNGEAVVVTHVPDAATDGDSMVHFRRSDVLATGDCVHAGPVPRDSCGTRWQHPGRDRCAESDPAGSRFRLKYEEGGTYVIPGRGRSVR